MLAGRDIAHTAPYGWNGKYARLEDYIAFTIRERMQGYGLSKKDLSALARYVREGLRPVAKPAPSDALAVRRGRVIFHSSGVGCSSCHGAAEAFTDGETHDVGSMGAREYEAWRELNPAPEPPPVVEPLIRPVAPSAVGLVYAKTSRSFGLQGPRWINESLLVSAPPEPPAPKGPPPVPASMRRFDTPSLEQVALTAPYLHDGSAKSIEQVLTRLGDHMGTVSALTARERGDLVAYLQTL
jgi:cytochrome c peroxidase